MERSPPPRGSRRSSSPSHPRPRWPSPSPSGSSASGCASRSASPSRSRESASWSVSAPARSSRFSGLKGPLIVLGAPLSFALYNVLLKPLFARYDLLALTATTSLVGTVALLPIVASSDLGGIGSVAGRDIALILYLGILSTLLGYIGWNIGLRAFGATRAVTATYAIPALAILFGAVTLEEPVTAWIAVGGLLIVGGVALASFRGAGRGRGVRDRVRPGARRPEGAPRAPAAEPTSRAR